MNTNNNDLDKLDRDQVLMKWKEAKDWLQQAKDYEMDMRKYVVSRSFPEAKEGVNTLELGEGYKLKASVKFNYNLKDVETVKNVLYRISEIGNQGSFIANKLVKWEPTFLLTHFRELEEQAKNGLTEAQVMLKLCHEMLIINDAAPTVNIVEPKAKK